MANATGLTPLWQRTTLKDGRRIAWQSRGHGTAVVIPNGLYYFDALHGMARDFRVIAYDLRNRGASDAEPDPAIRARGIAQDVEDLEALREAWGLERLILIGHSYVAHVIALYAATHPARMERMVQIGATAPQPVAPDASPSFDATLARVQSQLAAWRQAGPPEDPIVACQQFWTLLRPIYVVDPRLAPQIDWGRCEHANERGFLRYFGESVQPSLARHALSATALEHCRAPVLLVHGMEDRSAPFAASLQWLARWPNARLLAMEAVGHAPWIESRRRFEQALRGFLAGAWPRRAQTGAQLESRETPADR